MSTPCALLLGFEPFAGEAVNPSAEIVRQLEGTLIGAHRVFGSVLPVAFAEAPIRLAQALDQHRPELVIAQGQAGGRADISLERVAINLIDARIADNSGLQPIDVEVLRDGPGAYFSTLPLKAIHARLRQRGVPASLSLSAGSYVCNQVFYALMAMPVPRAGFLHLGGELDAATAAAGVRVALGAALRHRVDIGASAGALD